MVGVTVNYNVTMKGFEDDTVEIRWSLYSAKSSVPVPQDWLRTRTALTLQGQAPEDSGGDPFWVPIPRRQGRYFIRVSVHDENDTRLDYADTPRFG